MKKSTTILASFWLGVLSMSAQEPEVQTDGLFKAWAQTEVSGSTNDRSPFWFRTNQFGAYPVRAPFGHIRAGFAAEYEAPDAQNDQLNRKPFDYGYGVELVANLGNTSGVVLREIYAKFRWKAWELSLGRRKEWLGLADSTLSSGSYAWSGNALPMPKVVVGLPDFTPIRWLNNRVSLRAFVAHGWLDPTRADVKGGFLHQKAAYIRWGKVNASVHLWAGINHQVQWGGWHRGLERSLPSDGGAFWYALTASKLPSDSAATRRYGIEAGNRMGNHLGTLDLGIRWNWDGTSMLLYRQQMYEDGSILYAANLDDALTGLSITNHEKKKLHQKIYWKKIVLEWLHTQSQGGGVFTNWPISHGLEDYFNNFLYTDGWSYFGRPVGNAFLTPQADLDLGQPFQKDRFVTNNRVSVWHLAMSGEAFEDWSWSYRLSFSQNKGTYQQAFNRDLYQFSGYFGVEKPLTWWEGARMSLAFGADLGNLYPQTWGIQLGLSTVFSE
jgi:Capsule assembly protein Wzi